MNKEAEHNMWKIKILGNSMEPLLRNGEEVKVLVNTNCNNGSAIEIGRVIILQKDGKSLLIIHRVIGKFYLHGRLCFLEKGDFDYYPKLCLAENIKGKVTAILGRPDLEKDLHPPLWQKQNQKLIIFYKIAIRVLILIEGKEADQKRRLIKRAQRKVFWSILHCICSFFNLMGNR